MEKREKEGSKIRDYLYLIIGTIFIFLALLYLFLLGKIPIDHNINAKFYLLSSIVQINIALIAFSIIPVSIFNLFIDKAKNIQNLNNTWSNFPKKKNYSKIIYSHYNLLFAVCLYMIFIIIISLMGIIFSINEDIILIILTLEGIALIFFVLSAYAIFDLFESFVRASEKDN